MKKQTVTAFRDISAANDNVLIYVLCGVMLEEELPMGIVRFMWNLLWRKTFIFCVGVVKLTHKGPPPGSVLMSVQLTRVWYGNICPFGLHFFQYADDIVVYSSHHVLQTACALVQMACSSLNCLDWLVLIRQSHATTGLDLDW
jgi:hypothetical protein